VRRTWLSLRSRGFAVTLAETLVVALALRGAAVLLTRAGAVQPWPELLALLSEHALWLLPALRLRRFEGAFGLSKPLEIALRTVRVPLMGGLAGALFGVFGVWLAMALPPTRSFYAFQALIVPDPLNANVGLLALTTALRFSFVYAIRAVWLEGKRALRWRLTSLALFGGVIAAGIVAVLPGLVALVRNPSANLTGEALNDAANLSKLFQSALNLAYDDVQLLRLFDYLERTPRSQAAILESDTPREQPSGRVALLIAPNGQVVASNDKVRYAQNAMLAVAGSPWGELLEVASSGRCRAVVAATEVYAACPVVASSPNAPRSPMSRPLLLAGIVRPVQSVTPFSDFAAQVTHDFTIALDTLSQGFLPFFLGLGFLGYAAALRLTKPLERLLSGVRALEAGRFDTRVALENDDEVTRLGTGFNAMAQQLERSVQQLRLEQKHTSDLLDSNRTLTANASHELRTPIAVMRAHLESAEMRNAALTVQETELLHGEVLRLERLVEDLFTLSRAELQRLELKRERVSLFEVTSDLTRALHPLARVGSVTLLNEVSPGLRAVAADHARLEQVLRNLVTNAIRYTPEGGIVRLSARARGDTVALSVQDTGIGIEPEDLTKIFEPFYRADPARTRSSGGSGLGLTLVRELMERMNGRITAESTPGRGSTFTLELGAWREPMLEINSSAP
jgi:signal transduction histidine kinase